jgi:hypothetical protein
MKKESEQHLPPDFTLANEMVYHPAELMCKNVTQELESQEYGALTFDLNQWHVKFRVAKITPRKVGQFVTLWKRIGKGPILPFDITDSVDFFIISVRQEENFGQIIFPQKILQEKGVISTQGKGGKRAIRVYPPWDQANNAQASKSQTWQLKYFFQISPGEIDREAMQRLLV